MINARSMYFKQVPRLDSVIPWVQLICKKYDYSINVSPAILTDTLSLRMKCNRHSSVLAPPRTLSLGMAIRRLLVISAEMISAMFECVVKTAVEDVRQHQDVHILHGQHAMVILVGWREALFPKVMLFQPVIEVWCVVYCDELEW